MIQSALRCNHKIWDQEIIKCFTITNGVSVFLNTESKTVYSYTDKYNFYYRECNTMFLVTAHENSINANVLVLGLNTTCGSFNAM